MSGYPELEVNEGWIDRLGVEGHSGDESDHHGDQIRYVILTLPWRADELTRYVRALDVVHIAKRFFETGRAGPGNWPRKCIPNQKRIDSASAPVRGLPRNFYNAAWLLTQSPETIATLNIQDVVVDLTIPASVQRWICSNISMAKLIIIPRIVDSCAHVTGPETPPLRI